MLALGTAAQTAACAFVYGVPYLADELRHRQGLTLTQVGVLVACPTAGLVLALYAWGAAADRFGERVVIACGLGVATLALAGAAAGAHGMVPLGALLAVAGAAGASVYSASGRLVMGWFGRRQRGLAMGIRQTATPLGMGVAALAMPPLATAHGLGGALGFLAAITGVMTVLIAVFAANPARPERAAAGPAANPYRGSRTLPRLHGSAALLVVPQFTAGAFALVLLTDVCGWSPVHAGQLIALAQALGAVGRVLVGRWSDRTGSRLREMRQLAVATAAVVAGTALATAFPSPLTPVLLVVAIAITASTNGLSFTSTAEIAGSAWSGRALGLHNTGQNLTAALVPPAAAVLISATGYWPAFVLAAAVAALSATIVPVAAGPGGAKDIADGEHEAQPGQAGHDGQEADASQVTGPGRRTISA
ncbi:MFS transporter [Streptomyces sp. KK5PA1]|uniref:MFS transporter n=2 Tax=Actinacidiphila acididurans TaxID=2784346 RepID=A0ABS2TYN6_9ACTN|nr:MFS transporter [Actinacidiphila acididurans]